MHPLRSDEQLQKALALHRAGRVGDAKETYRCILADEPDNKIALHYMGLAWMQQGDLQRADAFLTRAVALDSEYVNALADLGAVKAKQLEYESSVELLSKALSRQPGHWDALFNLVTVFNQLKHPERAIPHLERHLDIFPESVDAIFELAQIAFNSGSTHRAGSLLNDAIALEPSHCKARVLLGDVLEALGRFRPAKIQYLHVLRRKPFHPAALAKLLQMRGESVDPIWAERAKEALRDRTLARVDYIRLRIAMGYYYDGLGDYDLAFENFHAGYNLQNARNPFDTAAYSSVIDRLIRAFSDELLQKFAMRSSEERRPIFIVGMPRSGTTLVEQILASHSAVAAGGELSTLMTIASQLSSTSGSRSYPEGLVDIGVEQLTEMAERYLSRLNQISTTAGRVTDKQPFNYMHLGLAQLLFPKAAFIHCRRNPLDTCISCYFVSFSDSFAFANDLGTLGRYYRQYARIMDHWHKVLPVPVLNVQYEDLVENFDNVARQIVAHCGLPWEEACLRFYETKGSVRTPSRWQVRQPIYADSMGRWKRYARHLGPLMKELE